MATSNQGTQETLQRRVKRRRLILIAWLGLAAILWGPRAAVVVVDGWQKSQQVIDHQAEIDATQERIGALEREVAYAETPLGRDVEAKRRFGVGPGDEIWITVEAERSIERVSAPVSLADRVNGWLADAGGEFTGRVRDVNEVLRYWLGLDEVSHGVEMAETDSAEDEEIPVYYPASDGEAPRDAYEADDATQG